MDILIQHYRAFEFNPQTQLAKSPINYPLVLPSLSNPGIATASLVGNQGNLADAQNIIGWAIVYIDTVTNTTKYLPVKVNSISVVDPSRNPAPQVVETPFLNTLTYPQVCRIGMNTAEGYNSFAPGRYIAPNGDVVYASILEETGINDGMYIANQTNPLKGLKTAQFQAGVMGASSWTRFCDGTPSSLVVLSSLVGSVSISISVDFPLDAQNVPVKTYLVRGKQYIERPQTNFARALPNTGAFETYNTTGCYWRLDNATQGSLTPISRNATGNYAATLAFAAAASTVTDTTSVLVNPQFTGPLFSPDVN